MIKQFYMDNEKVDEKRCDKNRCTCLIVQYAISNNIKKRVAYLPKQGIEKIGFYDVKDYDALRNQIYHGCTKCK